MKPETPESLSAGRELFNQRRYFDAHEVWEVAWRKEEGETRAMLQALILVAAGCHKASVNEPRGTVKLLGTAVTKLAAFPELDVFRQAVVRALEAAERWQAGGEPFVPALDLA
jgi:predicted metal-dependent hydrolase